MAMSSYVALCVGKVAVNIGLWYDPPQALKKPGIEPMN